MSRVASALLLFCLAGTACAPPAVEALGPAVDEPAGGSSGNPGRHHPEGFAAANMHGPSALFVEEDCRTCHGAELDGGSVGVSCNTCHADGWRQTCTFCHGGTDNATGAPPNDISGLATPELLTFRAHTTHVTAGPTHGSYDCQSCHGSQKPMDALDAGHWFDDTPGEAEVSFTGLNTAGAYDGAGQCSTNYCHGNGRAANGTVLHDEGPQACGSCHAALTSTATQWATMSGDHRRHLGDNMTCVECHGATVSTQNVVNNPDNHINGQKNVMFTTSAVVYNAATRRCTGTCHGANHNDTW